MTRRMCDHDRDDCGDETRVFGRDGLKIRRLPKPPEIPLDERRALAEAELSKLAGRRDAVHGRPMPPGGRAKKGTHNRWIGSRFK